MAASTPPSPPDVARPLYRAIDWSRCIIGGSYALQQYLGDTHWQPNDIDIPCAVDSHEDFVKLIETYRVKQELEPGTKVTLNSMIVSTNAGRGGSSSSEGFDPSVTSTANLTMVKDGVQFPLPIQFVGVKDPRYPWWFRLFHLFSKEPSQRDKLVEHYSRIADMPACVAYVATPARTWFVPDFAKSALKTRTIRKHTISADRREKYAARGFTFVE